MAVLVKDNVVKIKEDQREIDSLIEQGYELVEPKQETQEEQEETQEETPELTRDELKAALAELGVEFKGNASNAELKALHDEAKGSN